MLPRREKKEMQSTSRARMGHCSSQPGASPPCPGSSAAPLTLVQGISISGQVVARGTLDGISPSGINTQSAERPTKAGREAALATLASPDGPAAPRSPSTRGWGGFGWVHRGMSECTRTPRPAFRRSRECGKPAPRSQVRTEGHVLAGLPGPGSAARARHCSGCRREQPVASVLWEAAAERRPDPVQLGSDGNQDHCSERGGRRPRCGVDAGYAAHLAPINSQAKKQACMWVQMECQGPRAGGHSPPPRLCCNEVPTGGQQGRGDVFPCGVHCLVTITGILSAPTRTGSWGALL